MLSPDPFPFPFPLFPFKAAAAACARIGFAHQTLLQGVMTPLQPHGGLETNGPKYMVPMQVAKTQRTDAQMLTMLEQVIVAVLVLVIMTVV